MAGVIEKTSMALVFIYMLQLCYFFLFAAASGDAITTGKPLRYGEVVVSKGGKFALGFFTPGKSRLYYVGIWFHNLPKTVVWVANRDNPMNDTSGFLYLNEADGNLVLRQNSTNMLIWSTDLSVTGNYTAMAQLTDIGNLVMIGNESPTTVLWQSFDHPTDTFLPYSKLGFNKRTGQNWMLQSWKTEDDPATGSISLRFNTSGRTQVFLYNKNVPLWRVGYFFSGEKDVGSPSMRRQVSYAFNLSVTEDDNEVQTLYHLADANAIFRVGVVPAGYMQAYKWDYTLKEWKIYGSYPQLNCESYGTCGANSKCDSVNYAYNKCFCLPGFEPRNSTQWQNNNDASAGCARKKGRPSMCRNGEGFIRVESVKIPDTSTVTVQKELSMEECQKVCLRNCSCNAYAVADVTNGTRECLTWHGTLMDTQVSNKDVHDLYVRVDAIDLANYARRSKRELTKAGKVGILTACVTLITLIIAFFVYCKRRKGMGIVERRKSLGNSGFKIG
ncbi:unnamed protein product [Cuscuta campestris]|uniref:Bulb-type lectin domain-containing protein n=1 Tax=Cuscuta campestris TaxID=132261 RepID=A0A484LZ08_9ASTE|nr:unnamed protein product [Cuscuta campestris]